MGDIKRVAVLGSGVMGSGIAAHFANAGCEVLLYDIAAKEGPRNAIAAGAIARMLKTDPAPLMSKRFAKRLTPLVLEDDLDQIGTCDFVVEVIVENLDLKKALYERLEKVLKKDAIISSNTSTIPLSLLTEGRSAAFKERFLITHFFNPPRYMRLLEIVKGPETKDDVIETVRHFADKHLGKGVVLCNDRPGFIANRIGTYWMLAAAGLAYEQKMKIEDVDALLGRPFGMPKTGVFGLIDLVGLDIIPHIVKSMGATLEKDDAFHNLPKIPDLFMKMIDDGYTGRKGKGGFYRLEKVDGKKQKQGIDFKTEQYVKSVRPKLSLVEKAKKDIKKLLESKDAHGAYTAEVVVKGLNYAASLVPEIADDIVAVDEAMRLGYNWKMGPFELIDYIGADWLSKKAQEYGLTPAPLLLKAAKGFYGEENGARVYLKTDGTYVPVPKAEGVLLLDDVKRAGKPLFKNAGASLWDIGDDVVCLEFHTKMNAIDQDIMKAIAASVDLVQKKGLKGIVIYNDGRQFSAGANIGLALFAANLGMWPMVDSFVAEGQKVYKALKYAPFPVVGAPSGIAVGGGCEVLLHCDAVQAHAETYTGLVEVGVGLVPAWGGCKEFLTRWLNHKKRPQGPMPAVGKVFEMISTAQVAKSAEEAREMLILREDDDVTMNRDRLLQDAKDKVLSLAEGYSVPEPQDIYLPGNTSQAAFKMAVGDFAKKGIATPYDVTVLDELGVVLSGEGSDITDPVTEDRIFELEKASICKLLRNKGTLQRIEHMLETGKPLRN